MTPNAKTYAGRWRTLAVLCLSLVVITIDSTIVSVALPTIGRELEATTGELQWFVDSYTLAITGLLLLAGAVGDRFGRHRVLASGLGVFALGSVLAAFSSTANELIVARVVMGAGAAAIMPATLSIIIDVFTEPVEHAQAIAIWAGMSGIGVALGPTLGGWLLEHFAWGAVFIVNLPVVAIALLAGRRFVPVSRARPAPRLDLVGGALASVGFTALTWAIIAALDHGWLSSTTIAVGIAAALLLGAFLWWELRVGQPMIDLTLFRDRRFSAGSLAITVVFFVLFGTLFGYTQILQLVLGHSALVAGLCAIPMAVALGVSASLSAAVARRLGTKLPVAGGLIVMAVGV